MRKKAFITGITGQDGSYLAEFLLQKGYEVHGLVRRSSVENTSRIKELIQSKEITLHEGDMTDACGLLQIIRADRSGRNLQSGSTVPCTEQF